MKGIALAVLSACCLAGCSHQKKVEPPPAGKIAKFEIDGTTAMLGECDGKPAVLVWIDNTDCECAMRYEGSHVVFQGFSGIRKGPRVEWWCATTGDGTGQVRIHRKPHALADGNVFVISTGKEVVIEQTQKDLSSLKSDAKSLEAFKADNFPRLSAREEKKKSNP